MNSVILNCVFAYKCDKKWDDLSVTKIVDVKFCHACQREVYFCRTDTQLKEAIVLNRCVSISFEDPVTKVPTRTLGVPAGRDDDDMPF